MCGDVHTRCDSFVRMEWCGWRVAVMWRLCQRWGCNRNQIRHWYIVIMYDGVLIWWYIYDGRQCVSYIYTTLRKFTHVLLQAFHCLLHVLIPDLSGRLQLVLDGQPTDDLLLLQRMARPFDLLRVNLRTNGVQSSSMSEHMRRLQLTFNFSFTSVMIASRFSSLCSILACSASFVWVMNSWCNSSFLRAISSIFVCLAVQSDIFFASSDYYWNGTHRIVLVVTFNSCWTFCFRIHYQTSLFGLLQFLGDFVGRQVLVLRLLVAHHHHGLIGVGRRFGQNHFVAQTAARFLLATDFGRYTNLIYNLMYLLT